MLQLKIYMYIVYLFIILYPPFEDQDALTIYN